MSFFWKESQALIGTPYRLKTRSGGGTTKAPILSSLPFYSEDRRTLTLRSGLRRSPRETECGGCAGAG